MDETVAGGSAAAIKVGILGERNMRWYFGTQLFSLTGLMLRQSVLSLLIIKLVGIKDAPPLVGRVWGYNVLPGAFLGIFAGLLIDRYDKRNILRVTAVLGMVQASVLAYFCFKDIDHVPLNAIMGVMIFTGFTNAVDGIARNAIVKDAVVHKYNQAHGGIVFNSLYTIGMIIGNGIAGPLILSIGYGATFVLNGLSFVILIFGLSMMNFDHIEATVLSKKEQTRKGVWHLIQQGFSHSFHVPLIRACILLTGVILVFGFSYNVILSIITKQMFGGGPKQYSYLAAVSGVGSLCGSLLAIAYGKRMPKRLITGGCVLMGIGQLFFARCTNIDHAAMTVFLCGLGFMASFLPFRGAMMRHVSGETVGIVFGIMFMFFYGGMMLSSFGSGYLAKHYGCPFVLTGCGVALLVIAATLPLFRGFREISNE